MTKEQGIEERCRWNCAWKGGGPCLAEDCPRRDALPSNPLVQRLIQRNYYQMLADDVENEAYIKLDSIEGQALRDRRQLLAQVEAQAREIERLQRERDGARAQCIIQMEARDRLRAALGEIRDHIKQAEGFEIPYSAGKHFSAAYKCAREALGPAQEPQRCVAIARP